MISRIEATCSKKNRKIFRTDDKKALKFSKFDDIIFLHREVQNVQV